MTDDPAPVPTARLTGLPRNIAEIRARFPLDAVAEAALVARGFVVLDGGSRGDLSDAYPKHGPDPHLLVTTDAMLTLWHALQRRALASAEELGFLPSLGFLVPALARAAAELRAGERDPEARAALGRAGQQLAVAARLLDEGFRPDLDLQADCDAAVAKVLAHAAMEAYPSEDFTQYAVRGHYAGSPDLARYFYASLWLSRQFLSVDPAPVGDPDGPLRTAVALAATLREAPEAAARLEALNGARASLAGAANAVSAGRLLGALDGLLGSGWHLDEALRPGALADLRRDLRGPAYPKVAVQTRPAWPDAPFPEQIVTLLPDAVTPDGLLFQATVEPAVPGRSLPSGLQVGAALGFGQARSEIEQSDPAAASILAASDGRPLPAPDDGSVYGTWLRALAALSTVDPRAPSFMQGEAWGAKGLNTALAGWAQLRHNFILLAAQSYAQLMGLDEVPTALVEPNPAFFRALAALAERTREALGGAGALTPPDGEAMAEFGRQCLAFAGYAEAELTRSLTPDQAREIGLFGSWLERFGLKTDPTVADVATGQDGEVLHAATGALSPLIAVPDPEDGTAYVGWTMSYYEFARPAGDRLTDERWRGIASNPLLRPSRPAWAVRFLSAEAGAAWEARAPLREAERLAQNGQEGEAVALWRDLASRAEPALAAEAQCRLGEHFEARGDEAAALEEYLRCRRMRGGAAGSRARRRAAEITRRRAWEDRADVRTAQARRAEAERLLGVLEDAAEPAVREGRERRLAELLVRAFIDSHHRGIGDVLARAARACHTPAVRDALGYVALLDGRRGLYDEEADGPALAAARAMLREAALEYAAATGSVLLKGAAYAIAVDAGHLAGRPLQAADLLGPFQAAAAGDGEQDDEEDEAEQADPAAGESAGTALDAVGILRAAGRNRFRFDLSPADVLSSTASVARHDGIAVAYHEGRFEEMLAIDRLLPERWGHTARADQPVGRYWAYPEFQREPLRLYARAEGREHTLPAAAAEDFARVAQEFPGSPLALPALRKAEALRREAGDHAGAAAVRADVIRLFPNAAPAFSFRAREALECGDTEEARRWSERAEAAGRAEPGQADADLGLYPDHSLGQEIRHLEEQRAVLGPLAAAAGWTDLAARVGIADGPALADALAAALPGREREVYTACVQLNPYHAADLCLRLLARFPDDPSAMEWWAAVLEHGGAGLRRSGLAETLVWLAPLLERGKGYPATEQAADALAALLGAPPLTADGGPGRDTSPAAVLENCRFVRDVYPGTRAASVAAVQAARVRLESGHPEDALANLGEALDGSKADRPLQEAAERLAARARREVWAKGLPEWRPLWSTRVGSPEDVVTDGERDVASPLLAAGALVVPTVIGRQWSGLAALDAQAGTEWWATPGVGPVQAMDASPDGRLFCATHAGTVVALDLRDGRLLSDRPIDPGRRRPRPGEAIPGRATLAVCGSVLVVARQPGYAAGWSLADGRELWRRALSPVAPYGEESGRPAVIGGTAFLATVDGHVRALDGVTGAEQWSRLVIPEEDEEAEEDEWQTLESHPGEEFGVRMSVRLMNRRSRDDDELAAQPVALGPDRLLVATQNRLLVLASRSGETLRTAPRIRFGSFPNCLAASAEAAIEWDGNGDAGAWDLSTLSRLSVGVPVLPFNTYPAMTGWLACLLDRDAEEIQVRDLRTGALLSWWPHGASIKNWLTAGPGRFWVTTSEGLVEAFPAFAVPPVS